MLSENDFEVFGNIENYIKGLKLSRDVQHELVRFIEKIEEREAKKIEEDIKTETKKHPERWMSNNRMLVLKKDCQIIGNLKKIIEGENFSCETAESLGRLSKKTKVEILSFLERVKSAKELAKINLIN
jgi:DNA polymerase II small subunit/DNA polymerase delta subunit B